MGLCFLQNNNNQNRTAAGFGCFLDLGSQLPYFIFFFNILVQLAELAQLALFSLQDGPVVRSGHVLAFLLPQTLCFSSWLRLQRRKLRGYTWLRLEAEQAASSCGLIRKAVPSGMRVVVLERADLKAS